MKTCSCRCSYALPPEIGKVNVTMGYPLRASLAYTFVERLVELQAHRRTKGAGCTFYHADAVGILAHPYVADSDARETRAMQDEIVRERRISVDAAWLGRNDLLRMIFSPAAAWRELSDWLLRVVAAVARTPYEGDDRRQRVEFLAVISEEISKLRNSLDECDIELTTEVYTPLLRRHLQTVHIPYEGEPLEGVQVMGILETRNLDFENVVLLSMNDDNFPGNHMAQASFVPYNLRARLRTAHARAPRGRFTPTISTASCSAPGGCGCSTARTPTTNRRANRAATSTSSTTRADFPSGRSRWVWMSTSPRPIRSRWPRTRGSCSVSDASPTPESKATLSPTAFFRYVACPLRFYFHSVARLQADDEIAEEVDAPMFGTILHAAVQKLYARIVGEAHPGETLRAMIRTGEIAAAVEAAINENYLQDPAATTDDYTAQPAAGQRHRYTPSAGGVMPYDAAHDGFTVTGLEREVAYRFDFTAAGRPLCMKFAGIADRIDALDDGTLRVVDYKTGAPHLEFAGMESLFRGEGKQRLSNILQTLLYAMMLYRTRGVDAEPALYYVRAMNRPDYLPTLDDRETGVRGGRYTLYAERFEELVRQTLAELYDPSVPFRQCEDADTCNFCDFNVICKR
ncbi:MAG: PD-(D/E)XK nuclease family protein [Alistipes shahii]